MIEILKCNSIESPSFAINLSSLINEMGIKRRATPWEEWRKESGVEVVFGPESDVEKEREVQLEAKRSEEAEKRRVVLKVDPREEEGPVRILEKKKEVADEDNKESNNKEEGAVKSPRVQKAEEKQGDNMEVKEELLDEEKSEKGLKNGRKSGVKEENISPSGGEVMDPVELQRQLGPPPDFPEDLPDEKLKPFGAFSPTQRLTQLDRDLKKRRKMMEESESEGVPNLEDIISLESSDTEGFGEAYKVKKGKKRLRTLVRLEDLNGERQIWHITKNIKSFFFPPFPSSISNANYKHQRMRWMWNLLLG